MVLPIDVEGLLDEVVYQFSDPMAFFRELVQNAIDSGSALIEIEIEALSAVARIVVRDSGEGMTREIIESKLLRLFSSGKDDDLTKIGRFGIGFVSVFAVKPSMVVVDTGREGEYWRLIFGADRRYELRRLPQPVEGTSIEIHVPMATGDYLGFLQRAEEALKKWCRFAQVPIEVNGEEINEPYEMLGKVPIYHQEGATKIWLGFSEPEDAYAGYFHRGLMIKEEQGPRCALPWVQFRIDSPDLEHTLTRDQLLESRQFLEVLGLVEKLATVDLPGRLCRAIEELLEKEEMTQRDLDELDELYSFVSLFLEHHPEGLPLLEDQPLFRDPSGERYSLGDLKKLGRLNRLTLLGTLDRKFRRPSQKKDMCYPYIGQDKGLRLFFVGYLQVFVKPIDERAIEVERLGCEEMEKNQDFRDYVKVLGQVLKAAGFENPQWIGTDFGTARALQWRPGGVLYEGTALVSLEKFDSLSPYLLGPQTRVFINYTHEEVSKLIPLARREPEWAALALLRLLSTEREPLLHEERLLKRAMDLRAARLAEKEAQ